MSKPNRLAYCAHLHIEWMTAQLTDGLTHGWWACRDCKTMFTPSSLIRAELEDLRKEIAEKDAKHSLLKQELSALKHTVIVTIGGTDYEGFPTSEINYLQRLRILLEKESRVKELEEALRRLLPHIQPYKCEEYPATCGACGTPAANCDMDCMTAAHMSEHDAAIRRAEAALTPKKGGEDG